MTWLLAVALAVRLWLHEQAIGPWRAAGFVAGSLAVMGLLGLVFGLLGQGATLQDWGFGRFSADLLTFVNPRGASVVLPTLPTNENQYEGYAYLGVGGLFLAVVAVAAWLRSGQAPARVAPRHVPLIAAAVVMAVLALATPITLLGRPVLDLRAVYAPFAGLTSAFRASGRFIWPLYYLILLVLCTAVVRRLPRPWATATLAVAVLLQVLDVRPIQDRSQSPRAPDVQLWSLGAGHYRHLVLYPPQILWSARCLELGRHPEGYYAPLAYRAYLLGMTINSGYFSRGRLDAFADACTELAERVKRRDFASDTIYVVGAEALASVAGPGMTCGTIDGHNVCVSSAKVTPLERFLGASAGPRPLAHAAPGS
jgi:hypothetical protein